MCCATRYNHQLIPSSPQAQCAARLLYDKTPLLVRFYVNEPEVYSSRGTRPYTTRHTPFVFRNPRRWYLFTRLQL